MTDNEALYHFNKYCENCRNNAAMMGVKEEDILCDKCKVKNALDALEAGAVKHGHWIWDKCANMGGLPKCSVCGRRSHSATWGDEDNYCPRCGAKMERDLVLNEESEDTK